VISVFLGFQYFQERHIRKRLFGSVVMAAGAVLIVMFGARR
jgi:drug/metabolite transporter (DMT)-like permease